jgi:hypothetical protein
LGRHSSFWFPASQGILNADCDCRTLKAPEGSHMD